MIGLPAVALATTALDQTVAGQSDNRDWRYWVAGALFALVLQTKMFVGLMFPALALAAFSGADGHFTASRIGFARLSRLVLGIASVFLAVAGLLDEPLIAQLIAPHYRANFASSAGGIAYFTELLTTHIPGLLLLFFALGLLAIWRGLNAVRLIPVLWLVCAVSVLVFHRPLFEHHLLLIAPPIVWIAALSLHLLPDGIARRAVTTAIVLVLAIVGVLTADAWGRLRSGSLASRDAWRFPVLLATSSPHSWVAADDL